MAKPAAAGRRECTDTSVVYPAGQLCAGACPVPRADFGGACSVISAGGGHEVSPQVVKGSGRPTGRRTVGAVLLTLLPRLLSRLGCSLYAATLGLCWRMVSGTPAVRWCTSFGRDLGSGTAHQHHNVHDGGHLVVIIV